MSTRGRPRIYGERKKLLLDLPLSLVEFVSQYGHAHRLKVTAAIIKIIEEKRTSSSPSDARETLPHNSGASKLPDRPKSGEHPTVAPPIETRPTLRAEEGQLDKLARKFGLVSPAPTTPLGTQSCAQTLPAQPQKG